MNSSDDVAVEQATAIIDRDPVSAAAQLKGLADRGSPRAMAYLGCLHQHRASGCRLISMRRNPFTAVRKRQA